MLSKIGLTFVALIVFNIVESKEAYRGSSEDSKEIIEDKEQIEGKDTSELFKEYLQAAKDQELAKGMKLNTDAIRALATSWTDKDTSELYREYLQAGGNEKRGN